MVSIGVGSVSSLKLSSDCLESSGNNKNGDKNLVTLCQPQRRCNYIHRLGDLIK